MYLFIKLATRRKFSPSAEVVDLHHLKDDTAEGEHILIPRQYRVKGWDTYSR